MVASKKMQTEYINSLVQELIHYKEEYKCLETIYIGGGTPSFIGNELLVALLDNIKKYINLAQIKEFTIEANPNDVNKTFVDTLLKYNVNRVSLGVQTTNNDLLGLLKRTHNKKDIVNAIKLLQSNGISNINLDFIYQIPKQIKFDVINDLNFIKNHNINHISYYSLIIEERTELKYLIDKGLITPIDDDTGYEYSNLVKKELEAMGYIHYETSNYSKPGFESKHNLIYWNLDEYLGIGLSAASQYNDARYKNIDSISQYIKQIGNDIFNRDNEDYDPELEFLLMGLRKTSGVKLSEFKRRFKKDIFLKFPDLNKHLGNGLLKLDSDNLFLTTRGQDLANQVYIDLL